MPINVSEQIEEAMERGEFRNLPGKGNHSSWIRILS